MKYRKFEYQGADVLDACVRENALPPVGRAFPGLANTDAYSLAAMRQGDAVVIGTLSGEAATIHAIGVVAARDGEGKPPVVKWARVRHTVFPEIAGLVHWQTKSSFEISPQPAKRYGLKELIGYYIGGKGRQAKA